MDLNALEPWQDPAVWEMVSGGARAVHHIESPAMTSLCRQCNVRDIDTLTHGSSLIPLSRIFGCILIGISLNAYAGGWWKRL